MKAFAEKYPKDDKVYNAYETIAQLQTNAGQTDEALATYRDYVAKYPDNPQAALALVKVATMQRMKADGLGRYGALNEQERALWKTLIDGSIAASEELISKYPRQPAVPEALQNLLRIQRTMLTAELKKAPRCSSTSRLSLRTLRMPTRRARSSLPSPTTSRKATRPRRLRS